MSLRRRVAGDVRTIRDLLQRLNDSRTEQSSNTGGTGSSGRVGGEEAPGVEPASRAEEPPPTRSNTRTVTGD